MKEKKDWKGQQNVSSSNITFYRKILGRLMNDFKLFGIQSSSSFLFHKYLSCGFLYVSTCVCRCMFEQQQTTNQRKINFDHFLFGLNF